MGQSLCAGDRNSQATVFFKKSEMYTAVKKGSPYYQKKIDSRQKKLDEAKAMYNRYKKQNDNNRERANSAL